MMKIMIVDDQTPSRKQIKNELINLGYSDADIAEASNGFTALKLAEAFKPDILLTDISMPKMLGTDLASHILSLYPKCKIIFFSGYSDKEYLKAAIKLNVIDYLEKPLDSEEFAAAMKKAEDEIAQLDMSYSNDKVNSQFLECVFKNKHYDTQALSDIQKKILKNLQFVCAAVVPCSEYTTPVTGIISKASSKYSLNTVSRYKSDGTLEILFSGNTAAIKQDIEKVFRTFLSQINENEIFKCAIGSFEKSGKDIHISYENAVCALDSAFFHKPNTLVAYREAEKIIPPDSDEITESLYSALAEENYDGAMSIVNLLYKKLYKSNFIMSSKAKKIYYNMLETIHSFFKNYFVAYNSEYNLFDDTFNIHKAKFLDELNNHILSVLSKTKQLLRNTDFNSIVKSALYYMEKNYRSSNLSIIDIAQHCNVNANYLCGTFKSITGETINHYINNLRIENAKKLILETNSSISDISKQCGFNDAKYFCKVFGKYTKSTPTSFRKKYK